MSKPTMPASAAVPPGAASPQPQQDQGDPFAALLGHPDFGQMMQRANATVPDLFAPGDTSQPLTSGSPSGPGPGPEVWAASLPSQVHPLVQAATALNATHDLPGGGLTSLRDAVNAMLSNEATP